MEGGGSETARGELEEIAEAVIRHRFEIFQEEVPPPIDPRKLAMLATQLGLSTDVVIGKFDLQRQIVSEQRAKASKEGGGGGGGGAARAKKK